MSLLNQMSIYIRRTPPNIKSDKGVRGRARGLIGLVMVALALLLIDVSPLEAQEQETPEVKVTAGHTHAMQGAAMPALIDLGDIDTAHARWVVDVHRRIDGGWSNATDCRGDLMGSQQSGAPPLPAGTTSTYDGLPEVYASPNCPPGEYIFSLRAWDARHRDYVSDGSDPWHIEGRVVGQAPTPLGVQISITPSNVAEGRRLSLTASAAGGESSELYMSAGAPPNAKLYRIDSGDLANQAAYTDLGAFYFSGRAASESTVRGLAHDGDDAFYSQAWRPTSSRFSYIQKMNSGINPGDTTDLGVIVGRSRSSAGYIEGMAASGDLLVGVGTQLQKRATETSYATGIFSISKTTQSRGFNAYSLLQSFPAGLAAPLSTTWVTDRLLTLDGSGDELWQTTDLSAATSTTLVGVLPAGITDPTGAAWHSDQLIVADKSGNELWRVSTTSPGGGGTTLLGNLLVTSPEGLMSSLTAPTYTYAWTTTGGTLSSSSGAGVSWTAPADVSGDQSYTITVTVTATTGGMARETRSITVRDDDIPPGAPASMLATPSGDDGLFVQIASPTSGGVAASYEVRYRVCCSGDWSYQERAFRSWIITGLERGREYELQARAENAHGASPYTSPSIRATTRATRPDTPAAPTVTSVSDTRLAAAWVAPFARGARISSYDLRFRQQGQMDWQPVDDVAGTSHVITGLSVGTTYDVQVRATNSEGDSEWSATGQGTTEYPALDALSIAGSSWLTDRPGLALVDRSGGSAADAGFRWRLMPDPDPILLDNADVEARWLIEVHLGATTTSPAETVHSQAVTAANQLLSCGGLSFTLSSDRNACPTHSANVLGAPRLVWTAQVRNTRTSEVWQSPYSVTWLQEPREPEIGAEDHWTDRAPEVAADYADGRLTLIVKHPPGPGVTQVLINDALPIVRFDVPAATGTVATTTSFEHTPPAHSVRYYLTPSEQKREWITYQVRGALYAPEAFEVAVEGRDTHSQLTAGRWGYTQWTRAVNVPLRDPDSPMVHSPNVLQTPVPADPRFAGFARNLLEIGQQVSGGEPEDVEDDEVRRLLILLALVIAVGGGIGIAILTKIGTGLTAEGVASGTMFAAGMWAGIGYLAMEVPLTYALAPMIIPALALVVVVKQRFFE